MTCKEVERVGELDELPNLLSAGESMDYFDVNGRSRPILRWLWNG
jgi:hypothetical protein